MTPIRTLTVALALGSVLGSGCYSEQIPPSNFRFACESDGDCRDDEVCRRQLCERPCTQQSAAEDCPSSDGYVGCFNGVCATTCALAGNYCPALYECIDLGLDAGGGGSPFGGGSNDPVGICGLRCDADANADLCPTGEVCVAEFGTCAVDCSGSLACPAGTACVFGICAPEGLAPGGSSSGGLGVFDESGSSDESSGPGGSSGAMVDEDEDEDPVLR